MYLHILLYQLQFMHDDNQKKFCSECEIRKLQSQITKDRIENDIKQLYSNLSLFLSILFINNLNN